MRVRENTHTHTGNGMQQVPEVTQATMLSRVLM
jgi:hypothetical protein